MKRGILVVIFLVYQLPFWVYAQTVPVAADSLICQLEKGGLSEEAELQILIALSHTLVDAEPDTALHYLQRALGKAKGLQDKESLAEVYYLQGKFYRYQSQYLRSISSLEQAMESTEQLPLQAQILRELGVAHKFLNNNTKALFFYRQAIDLYDQIGDEMGMASCNNSIAIIHTYQKDYASALRYFKKTVSLHKNRPKTMFLAKAYNNLGFVYNKMGDYESALYWFQKSLEIKKKERNQRGVAISYLNMGLLYGRTGDYEQGLELLSESIEISSEIKDLRSQGLASVNMAEVYLLMGDDPQYQQENTAFYSQALELGQKAIQIGEQIDNLGMLKDAYQLVASALERQERSTEALSSYKKYVALKDSLFDLEQMRYIKEVEGKLRIQEHQREIEQQSLQLAKQESEIKRKNIQRNSLFIATTLSLILVVFIYRSYRIKKEANAALLAKNQKINQQKEEIHVQKERLEVQQEVLTSTLAENRRQNSKITDSIRYAKNIQQGVLPTQQELQAAFRDFFLIFLPKDIVSGDFYWLVEVPPQDISPKATEKYTFVAVVDCTGHGVPGAFMSMIGYTLLTEIVNQIGCHDPAQILQMLDQEIKKALHSSTKSNRDGMDVSICRLHYQEGDEVEAVFAGAKHPMYYSCCREKHFEKIRGDRHSVGGRVRKNRSKIFHNHRLSLKKGDILYLLSDGYVDQSNPELERFGSPRLEELLESYCALPLEEQEERLRQQLSKHQRESEQRDDITLMGIRL